MLEKMSTSTIVYTLLVVFLSSSQQLLFVAAGAAGGSGSTSTFKPEISIGINADTLTSRPFFGTFFEPSVKYTTSGTRTISNSDIAYEAGVTITGADNGSLPYNVWGKLKKKIQDGWTVATKFDTTSKNLQLINFDATVTGPTTQVQVKGQTNISTKEQLATKTIISSVKLIQSIPVSVVGPMDGSTVTVVPIYNFKTKQTDVSVSYNIQDTTFIIDANSNNNKQKYTIQQQLSDKQYIVPSITNTGDVQVEYNRIVGTTGSASIIVQPKSGIVVKYAEGSKWVATVDAPFTNGKFGHVNTDTISVSLKRSIS